jgi:hypothetical protein
MKIIKSIKFFKSGSYMVTLFHPIENNKEYDQFLIEFKERLSKRKKT